MGAGLFALFLVIVLLAAVALAQDDNVRATEGFRALHQELRTHTTHLTILAGKLPKQSPEEQTATMTEIVTCLTDNIHSHAKIEEDVLYPVVDKASGSPPDYPFTATMRYEHRIVGRWITELRNNANQPSPDITAFTRRTENLLGLISAHLEEEEDILLPVLDAKMTVAQFKKEVLDKMHE
jgi:iron-sulfur cluster repair protein YtfE (RIC family)